MKLTNADIIAQDKLEIDFPPVVVDQTNYRISEIIKRNRAGEQVIGIKDMKYDFDSSDKFDFEKVNPFVDLGFDLDDVIKLAKSTAQDISDLQNRQGELKAELDKAKSTLEDKIKESKQPKEVAKDELTKK